MTLSISSPRTEVGGLAVRPPLQVAPGTPIAEVAEAMRRADESCVLVGHDAIATERDLSRAWAEGLDAGDPVEAIASEHPFTVGEGVPVVEAAALMLNQGIRHLVVSMGDGTRSVVSLGDVLGVLLHALQPHGYVTRVDIRLHDRSELWLG